MDALTERFIGYVKEYTTSNPKSKTSPSTERQLLFGDKLAAELIQVGLMEVEKDQYGYVTATLPSNINREVPVVGFISHMDTCPDFSGENVNPRIIKYNGGDIILENNVVISPKQFPEIENYIGEEIITSDGNTLLGADDKAGIAEIITAMDYLLHNPEIKHGKIRICFTPDEEIGRGAAHFNVKKFGADFAYTLDGGEIGELEYENFNAAEAVVTIRGKSVHPGSAKDRMINAIHVGEVFDSFLPEMERPEYTEGREGFYHCISFEGTVEQVILYYIIRDHDRSLFETRKEKVNQICSRLNEKYGEGTVTVELKDQYYNMREKIEPVMYIVDLAKEVMEDLDIKPIIDPIRGGTDGAILSFKGLPCPNLFTGGHNFHGPYEYIPIDSMRKAVRVVIRIAEKIAKKDE